MNSHISSPKTQSKIYMFIESKILPNWTQSLQQ